MTVTILTNTTNSQYSIPPYSPFTGAQAISNEEE